MGRGGHARLRPLGDRLRRAFPALTNPDAAIAAGEVLVDGIVVSNPRALVAAEAVIRLAKPSRLRGEVKLEAALDSFELDPRGRTAVDAGAAAGGFTRALLAAGTARVYAVDAGHGQLLGSLRQSRRVVNLERTNLGDLDRRLVPDEIGLVTLDLSYLSLSAAIPQLAGLELAQSCDLVALVKPQFELRLATPPQTEAELEHALGLAAAAARNAGWIVLGSIRSPLRGARGSIEVFLHARRERA
jgi:23S rRNA (cytidine1920-2'-O)/16S rRNA (cytidine1409-2'-O)-methyltransferase